MRRPWRAAPARLTSPGSTRKSPRPARADANGMIGWSPARLGARHNLRQEKRPDDPQDRRQGPGFHDADRWRRLGLAGEPQGQAGDPVFLPEGRHLGLHRRSLRVSRFASGLQRRRRGGDRRVEGFGGLARQVQGEVPAPVRARLRRHRRGLRKIRDLDREEHVRPQIHGNRPQHLPDRQGRHPARHLAQGEGRGPCRRGAEGGEGALTATLSDSAAAILGAADPAEKVRLSRALAAWWRAGGMAVGAATPPARPGRPMRPVLLSPKEMPRRRNFGSLGGQLALLHALAHIELNAIDLGWDIVARFPGLPREFYDDWVAVAAEEAEHFALLEARLVALGGAYGDLPAHDGLWESAAATAHDLLARLAVVPLVLEARGLDVTPEMIRRLERAG